MRQHTCAGEWWAHASVAGVADAGVFVIAVRDQGRAAQPSVNTCSHTGVSGEKGQHAHCGQPASWEMNREHLPVLQQQCLGYAAKIQVVIMLLTLTEHSLGTLHEQHKALVHVQP